MRSRRLVECVVCLLTLSTLSFSCLIAQDRSGPERWEATIQKFEKQDEATPQGAGAVLFVGSSSIVFWNLDEWFPGRGFINRGFGGSTMEDLNHYFDRVVLPYAPSSIVLYSGDNDVAKGAEPTDIVRNYRHFFQRVASTLPGTPVVVVAVKPSLARWEMWPAMQEVNVALAQISAADPLLTFVDVSDVMLGADGTPIQELFVSDGLHMSAEGYRRWSRLLEPLLFSTTATERESAHAEAKANAMRVLDEFMETFNDRDEEAWTDTLHFPHVRIAGGAVRLDPDAASMMESFDFAEFARRFQWHHSEWLSREVVQAGKDKVHVAVRFARFKDDGSISAEFDSLYVIALRDGKWAVVSRSSFAP